MAVSESSLATLNQAAPASTRLSLERYLSSSAEEEGITATTRENISSLPGNSRAGAWGEASPYDYVPWGLSGSIGNDDTAWMRDEPSPWAQHPSGLDNSFDNLFAYHDSSQVVGTPHWLEAMEPFDFGQLSTNLNKPFMDTCSVGSVGSVSSVGSYRCYDARGTRQGRTTWSSTPVTPYEDSPQPQFANVGRYACTYGGCAASFERRYQWSRHEEAVHHVPFRWVCCPESVDYIETSGCFLCESRNDPSQHPVTTHFAPCNTKDEIDRTFYRQDQFAAHIKRKHCKDYGCDIPEEFLVACRSPNPSFNESSLRCPFCHIAQSSWNERQDHVFSHVEKQGQVHRVPNPFISQEEGMPNFARPSRVWCPETGCGVSFALTADLRRHMEVKHDPLFVGYQCSFEGCAKSHTKWSRLSNLKRHVRKAHDSTVDQYGNIVRKTCDA